MFTCKTFFNLYLKAPCNFEPYTFVQNAMEHNCQKCINDLVNIFTYGSVKELSLFGYTKGLMCVKYEPFLKLYNGHFKKNMYMYEKWASVTTSPNLIHHLVLNYDDHSKFLSTMVQYMNEETITLYCSKFCPGNDTFKILLPYMCKYEMATLIDSYMGVLKEPEYSYIFEIIMNDNPEYLKPIFITLLENCLDTRHCNYELHIMTFIIDNMIFNKMSWFISSIPFHKTNLGEQNVVKIMKYANDTGVSEYIRKIYLRMSY
jgi:hypothetical protein